MSPAWIVHVVVSGASLTSGDPETVSLNKDGMLRFLQHVGFDPAEPQSQEFATKLLKQWEAFDAGRFPPQVTIAQMAPNGVIYSPIGTGRMAALLLLSLIWLILASMLRRRHRRQQARFTEAQADLHSRLALWNQSPCQTSNDASH